MVKTKLKSTPETRLAATGMTDLGHRGDQALTAMITGPLSVMGGVAGLMSLLRHDSESALGWAGVGGVFFAAGASMIACQELSRWKKTREYLKSKETGNQEKEGTPLRNELRDGRR